MKRRHTYFFLILLSLGFLALSASRTDVDDPNEFSGKITYSLHMESKSPLVESNTLQEMYGRTMTLYIHKGNYKMVFDGNYIKEILYRAGENKYYLKVGDMDSIFWRDASTEESKYLTTHFVRGQDNILDRSCNAVSIETDWGTSTYLYDPSLYLNPKRYKEHGYGYFNLYMHYARAPYLKHVYDGIEYKKTLTAMEVERMEPDPSVFSIEGLPTTSAGF